MKGFINLFLFNFVHIQTFVYSKVLTDELACLEIKCNFENANLCNYENFQPDVDGGSEDINPNKNWILTKGRQNNPITGVRKSGEGDFYVATYLHTKDTAILVSRGTLNVNGIRFSVPFNEAKVIRFKFYKATEGIQLSACCDNVTNCPFVSEETGKLENYNKWRQIEFRCEIGTEKILFFGRNEGRNEGGIGVDDVQLFTVSSENPTRAETNLCDDQGPETQSIATNNLVNMNDLTMVNESLSGAEPINSTSADRNSSIVSNETNIASLFGNDNSTSLNGNSSIVSTNDFQKRRMKDSVFLSSRLILTDPSAEKPRNIENVESSNFRSNLNVYGLDEEPLNITNV